MLLQEPLKRDLVRYENNKDAVPPRRAFVIVQAWPQIPVVEAIVDLSSSRPNIVSWQEVR